MKAVQHGSKTLECYEDADLQDEEFVKLCEQAKRLWERRSNEYVEEEGHIGSAVIGAGFSVWYLPPKARKPRRKMILHSPSKWQGSLVWEHSKDEIEQMFRGNGIDVHYEWGVMD